MNTPDLLTYNEAAAFIGISAATLQAQKRNGRFNPVDAHSTRLLFTRAECERYRDESKGKVGLHDHRYLRKYANPEDAVAAKRAAAKDYYLQNRAEILAKAKSKAKSHPTERVCIGCGTPFTGEKKQRYCERKCQRRFNKRRSRERRKAAA